MISLPNLHFPNVKDSPLLSSWVKTGKAAILGWDVYWFKSDVASSLFGIQSCGWLSLLCVCGMAEFKMNHGAIRLKKAWKHGVLWYSYEVWLLIFVEEGKVLVLADWKNNLQKICFKHRHDWNMMCNGPFQYDFMYFP